MEHPFPAPGVEMITQEYLAASLELRSRTDLTAAQRERLNDDLADEHGLAAHRSGKASRPRCVPTRRRGAGAYRNRHLFRVGRISQDRLRSVLKTVEMMNQQG